jgi:hypothetical protein
MWMGRLPLSIENRNTGSTKGTKQPEDFEVLVLLVLLPLFAGRQ